jgi:hypothetical protein
MSIDDAGNAGKPKPGNDRIDLSRFRRAPEATGNGGSKRVGKRVEARKPAKDVFFRVHPGGEYRMAVGVLELKDEKEVYLVDLALEAELAGTFSSAIVLTAITRKGDVFLWTMTIADANGKTYACYETAQEVATLAETKWVSMKWDGKDYEQRVATAAWADPVWPSDSFDDLVNNAFKGRVITDRDHPVLRRFLGEE